MKPPVRPAARKQAFRPEVSVVMPVHNALPYLDQAVESILNQTFSDFEFVILDDASTDGSRERLEIWKARDSRIRLLTVDENLGPVGSSNMVARAARAPFVARMDADDISHPERFDEELRLLRGDADIGIVASVCEIINSAGTVIRGPEIWRLLRRSAFVPFAHGAMMYRREIFDQVGGYRKECEYWEDQDLVIRMAAIAGVVVIPRALYRVRQSATGTRALCKQERLERALVGVYRATDQLRDELNDAHFADASLDGKLDPRVFIALGSLQLWAGGRPHLLRRMLSHGSLSWDAKTASALVWTAWAGSNPSSLRWFLKFLLKLRNRFARHGVRVEGALQWNPLQPAEPYAPPAREKVTSRK
jgi:hypothetical protein